MVWPVKLLNYMKPQMRRLLILCLFAGIAMVNPAKVFADQIEVYFSPGEDHTGGATSTMKEALINFLKSATKSIDIAVYNFQDKEIIETLNTISAAGQVTIRVIVDDLNYPVRTSDGTLSLSSSIESKKDDKPEYEMHNKFAIVDRGESGAAVWTGSPNFNRPNMTTMNNNAVLIRNSDVAAAFGEEFDVMWSGKFHHNKTTPSTKTTFTVEGIPVEVRFSPKDLPLDKLISSVSSLTTSLYYAIYTYQSPDLENAMISKKSTVGSSNLGDFDEFMTAFTVSYDHLNSAGMNVMKDLNADVLHHKFAVLDGYTVFTGSMNFTVSGNDDNDENSVIIQDAAVAKAYLAELARISNHSIGTITAADWKDSIVVGSGTTTPVSTSLIEPEIGKTKAISYPNPFIAANGGTLTLRTDPEATLTSVRIYTIDGRLIYTMTPSTSTSQITWDGRNIRGEFLASGSYILEMETKSSGISRGIITLIK